MGKSVVKRFDDSIIIIGLLLLSGFYIYYRNLTAFDWPVLDMGTFWEREGDPNFLKNDFFANASSDLNPRHFYGNFVLMLSRVFNVSWYQVIYFFKIFFFVLFPPLAYCALRRCALVGDKQKNLNILAKLVLGIGCGLLLVSDWFWFIKLAWWSKIDLQMIPSTVSFFISLIIFCTIGKSGFFFVRMLLWPLAACFHPQVTLLTFIFYTLILFSKNYLNGNSLKKFVYGFIAECSCLFLGLGFLYFFYIDGTYSISTKKFIDIFVHLAHPHHYDIYRLMGHTIDWYWWESAGIVVLCFFSLALVLKRLVSGKIFWFPLILASIFCMTIFCQWFFIYIIPAKIVAIMGPVRYSFLSYYQILLCLILVLDHIKIPKFEARIKRPLPHIFSAALIFLSLGVGMAKIDTPKKRIYEKNVRFWSWLEDTPSDAVFAVPHEILMFQLGLVGKRSVFVGNGFPFSEKYFLEYEERYSALYGTYGEIGTHSYRSIVGLKENSIYHSRNMNHFLCLSKKFRLDYVIRQISFPFGEDSEEYSSMVVFREGNHIVYDLNKYEGEHPCS